MELLLDLLFSEVVLIPLTFIGILLLIWLKTLPDTDTSMPAQARKITRTYVADDAIYGRSPGGPLASWQATGAHRMLSTIGGKMWRGLHQGDWSGFALPRKRSLAKPVTSYPTAPAQVHDDGIKLLRHNEWWPVLLDRTYHLLFVGQTRSGKTMAAQLLLLDAAQRGQVAVIDPHGTRTNWPVRAIGANRNFEEIDAAALVLEAEMTHRLSTTDDHPRLTVVIDEIPVIAQHCQHAIRVLVALAQEAAKVNMKLVVLTQSPTVASLGLEGKGTVRENFSQLLLGGFAIKAAPELRDVPWPAVFQHEGQNHSVDRSAIPELLQRRRPGHINVWAAPNVVAEPASNGIQPTVRCLTITDDHIRVAMWLGENQNISQAEVARRLYGGNGQGRYNVQARALMDEVRNIL